MPKVYVINKSGHDYSLAEKYGELVYLTEGKIKSDNLNNQLRLVWEKLKDITEEDYILLTGLASTNLIVGWIVGSLNKNLNVLLFSHDKYLKHILTLSNLKE